MDQVDNAFPAFSTTYYGSLFVVEGLNYCSNKVLSFHSYFILQNKRKILKSFKGILVDGAVHEYAFDFYILYLISSHLILIKLLYCIDDTVLLNKTIFKEFSVNYQRLLESQYVNLPNLSYLQGCKVLLSILTPSIIFYYSFIYRESFLF